MINDATGRLDQGLSPAAFQVDAVEDEECAPVRGDGTRGDAAEGAGRWGTPRRVWGTLLVPSYTTAPGPGAPLAHVLAGGVPINNGEVLVPFLLQLPCAVLENGAAAVLQFGHGLLAHRGEARAGYVTEIAERTRAAVLALDWSGMSRFDIPVGPSAAFLCRPPPPPRASAPK